jgi:hypothetical protein
MPDITSLVWTIAVVAFSSAGVHLAVSWIRRRFPVQHTPRTAVRPFTALELSLGLLPLIVFLSGVLGILYLLDSRGLDRITQTGVLAYVGAVFLGMILIPRLVARAFGRKFYAEYFRLGELHGGISDRGANVFVGSIGAGFLIAAAVSYLMERVA